jgi:hypothetical protein
MSIGKVTGFKITNTELIEERFRFETLAKANAIDDDSKGWGQLSFILDNGERPARSAFYYLNTDKEWIELETGGDGDFSIEGTILDSEWTQNAALEEYYHIIDLEALLPLATTIKTPSIILFMLVSGISTVVTPIVQQINNTIKIISNSEVELSYTIN